MAGDDIQANISAFNGILLPVDDAQYVVALIDYLSESNKRGGARLSNRLMNFHSRLTASLRAITRADASAEVLAAQQVIALSPDACIGTAEAAELLGITADTVRWHCRKGNLEGRKMGRQVVITAASIDDLRARQAEKQDRSA